jgi:hypothetical protein
MLGIDFGGVHGEITKFALKGHKAIALIET